jgi:NADH:ubiquinone oxidoreductase subunit F (NADH-binding)/(2Fe-2S) ferredoxin
MSKAKGKRKILICAGTGCLSAGSAQLKEAFLKEIKKRKLNIEIISSGCHGFCEQGPIVVIYPEGVFYPHLDVKNVPLVIEKHILKGEFLEELFYTDPVTGEKVPYYREINFYKRQKRIVLQNCGRINPENIEEYLKTGGYEGLKKAISSLTPEQVIDCIKRSGLRGRGGAGFPTGLKWSFVREAPGEEKFVICNADEGDPGAFMDRSVLEGDPHRVIEGMIIAGYAVGAERGFVYVRAEYPLAVRRIRIAINQAKEKGFLGQNILGSKFSFEIEVKEGAGAFVCGEETALIASIEGRRGMPRLRPPFPAQSGLWGKPTCINNVETLANVPWIIVNGSEKFSAIGTERSKGTKIFALTGKIRNTGLVEVPMGTTLREIVFEIGGGIKGEGKFKAVQIGGPSGGCLPEDLLSLPIDYESLTEYGAIMGSGGMVVLDSSTCMVDLARYFLTFIQDESCGKCVPCRVGTRRMLEILEKITRGKGSEEDVSELEELAVVVKTASLCGLGQTGPNPVLTTLRYFRDEYEEHVREKHCPAGVCKELTVFVINEKLCTGCGVCKKHCPVEAIVGERKEPHKILEEKCIRCGICKSKCAFEAIYQV